MRIIAILVFIFLATPAFARSNGAVSFKMADICTPSKIPLGGSAEINRRKLVGQVLKSAGVADIDIDPEGGDVDFAMKKAAIADPNLFCNSTKKCSAYTKVKLGGAYIILKQFIQENSKKPPKNTGGFFIMRTRGNVTGEITPRELMDSTFTGISARCIAPVKTNGSSEGSAGRSGAGRVENGGKGTNAKKSGGRKSKLDLQFMIRKDVADLDTLQSSDAFKALDRASFAVSSDYLKSTYTYNINGVAGIGLFKFSPARNVDADLIAYGLYTRQLVAGQVPKSAHDIDNIGGGFADNFHFDVPAGAFKLQWSAQYLESRISNGQLWSTSLTYIPLTGPLIGRAKYFGPFALLLLPRITFTHGSVIDHGLDPDFVANKEFDRIGGHLEAVVFFDSIDPNLSWMNGFSWRNIYDFYYGITGYYRTIDRFESKISYKFPDQKYWSIDLDYISGRNLDSLQLQQQLTLGVGLKF